MRHLSALEMAQLVWGNARGRRIMIAIQAAFDSSKDHPHGVTTVAGYIADAEKWQSIEDIWNGQLALAQLENFHLSDIKKRFRKDSWLDVVRPFAKIVQKADLRSISASMIDTDWAQLDHESAYRKICPHREHACLDVLFGVLAEEVELELNSAPVAVVFDNDWGNRDAIVRIHDAWCERTGHPGFNIFLKGGVPWDCVPLQCADLLAGLLRLNPVSRDMLSDETGMIDDNDPLTDIAGVAQSNGRGAMWSSALAERVEEILGKHGQ